MWQSVSNKTDVENNRRAKESRMHHHIDLLKCLELYHPPKRDSTLGTPSLALALKKSLMHAFTSLISITLDTSVSPKEARCKRRCCYKKEQTSFLLSK
jgi:hypothetical protein